MVGKRKAKPGAPSSVAQVLLPEAAAEAGKTAPWRVVGAVVDFANAMMHQGLYIPDELPPGVMQAYHADYYLAQVNNGGHSQFIHNSRVHAETTWRNAAAGLTAMGATRHAAILDDMLAWARANPAAVEAQTGFEGGRAPELDALDERFYALEKTDPMATLSARWILGWPETCALPDADYAEAMRRAPDLNPAYAARLEARRFVDILKMTIEPAYVGFAFAAMRKERREMLIEIQNGHYEDVEGVSTLVWRLRASDGLKFGVADHQGCRLYDALVHDNPPMPAYGDSEGMKAAIKDGRLAAWRAPEVGALASRVSMEELEALIHHARQTEAAAGAHLLLRRVGAGERALKVAPIGFGVAEDGTPTATWVLDAAGERFLLHNFVKGCVLTDLRGDKRLAQASAEEIRAHLERIGAA